MNPSSPVQRRDVEATDDTHLADIRLVTPDGASTTLAAELGTKPVLVNIWQADCAPCTAEMPLLGRIRGAMPDIDILGINSLEPLSKAHAAVRSTGIRYRWLRDPDGEFFVASDGVAVPRSLLVDLSGRVLDVRSGTFRSTQEIRRWIDGALRRTPGP